MSRLVATASLPTSSPPPSLAADLQSHVAQLSGQRSYRDDDTYAALEKAAGYIEGELRKIQASAPRAVLREQRYFARGRCYRNLELELPGVERSGRPAHSAAFENVIIGAHYDADGCESDGVNPGADDNASGVAALIELARMLASDAHPRTLRFVAFSTEEPPFFQTDEMGSVIYARSARARGMVIPAMLALESIGYYDDTPGSQHYPLGLGRLLTRRYGYPDRGNFIAFVADRRSRPLVQCALDTYDGDVPAEGVVAWRALPGVGWSDHWSFWRSGYPALMVTDTAPMRNPCYHAGCDRPGLLDYQRMADVVIGLRATIRALAEPERGGCQGLAAEP
jgi:hypothetical protein